MKRYVLLAVCGVILSGCAGSYSPNMGGPVATVTYIRQLKNHYIAKATGQVVAEQDRSSVAGPIFATENLPPRSTVVYTYSNPQCTGKPAILGSVGMKNYQELPLTVQVNAGIPLNNSYRTSYFTCGKDCSKSFYTSSVFTPESGARYEVVVEPIDGAIVYKIENDKRIQLEQVSTLPEYCRF